MKARVTAVGTTSDPTQLTDGWHPGYIVHVQEVDTPDAFTLSEDPLSWRWHLLLWEDDTALESGASPERQSGLSTRKLNERSKAYEWMKNLVGAHTKIGEDFDFDTLTGMACLVRGEPRTPAGKTEAFFKVVTLDRAQPAMMRRPVPAVVTLAIKEHAGDLDDVLDPKTPQGTLPPGDDDIPL